MDLAMRSWYGGANAAFNSALLNFREAAMPKLKVPSVPKPAKNQMTLQQFQRRPLHAAEAGSGAVSSNLSLHLGRLPVAVSSQKHNGLRPAPKGFSDLFGDSDDEVKLAFYFIEAKSSMSYFTTGRQLHWLFVVGCARRVPYSSENQLHNEPRRISRSRSCSPKACQGGKNEKR